MDEVSRLRYGALAIFGFAILLWIGVNAFAAGEAIGKRPFGWLVLVPVALWGLRIQICRRPDGPACKPRRPEVAALVA